ncbi:hypothetical protein [Scytonema hofmannii]|nr:hypothetical protein [Scytonema hofmannii]
MSCIRERYTQGTTVLHQHFATAKTVKEIKTIQGVGNWVCYKLKNFSRLI